MDNTQHNTLCTNIRIKVSPHGWLCTKFFRGCQIHLRSIIGRRCCISVRQYPKQRVYLQIFLHDQGCVIFEWSQFMQFCPACTYPAFGGHSRLFSRQEEKATVDLLSSRLDGSLLRPRFTISLFGEADRSISVPPSPFVWQGSMRLLDRYVKSHLDTMPAAWECRKVAKIKAFSRFWCSAESLLFYYRTWKILQANPEVYDENEKFFEIIEYHN